MFPVSRNHAHRPLARLSLALVAVALAVFVVAGSAAAQGAGVTALREAARAAETRHDDLVAAFRAQRATYDALTARIESYRTQMGGAFDIYELRAALREAQVAAEALGELDTAVRGARAELRDTEAALAEALRGEVGRLEAALRSNPADAATLVGDLNRLSDEIASLVAPLPAYEPVPIEEIIRGVSDAPEEIYDAVAELADAEARLERQLDELRARMRDAEASARVLDAAGEFAVEESLLDDDGGRRFGPRGPTRTPTASDGGTSGDRGTDTSNEGGPTATPGDADGVFGETPTGQEGPMSGDGGGAGAPAGMGDADDGDFGSGPPPSDPGETDDRTGTDSPLFDFGESGTLGPPGAAAVGGTDRTGDPTVVELPDVARRRSGTAVEALREREAQLVREIESIRDERERLSARARALESLDR